MMTSSLKQVTIVLCFSGLLPMSGCDAPAASPNQPVVAAQEGKVDLPGPKSDPNRDEAAELIKVCGPPTSDTSKSVQSGTQRILSWHRYGVDVFFIQNLTYSPKWASIAAYVGEDNINRKVLSRKMPCSKKVSLYSVDVMDPYVLSH